MILSALLLALASHASAAPTYSWAGSAWSHLGIKDEGLGLSAALDFARLGLDGSGEINHVGAGAGVSWKFLTGGSGEYPLEIAGYLNPSATFESTGPSVLAVGVGVSVLFLKTVGLGIYWDAWRSRVGLQRPGKATVSLTVPWGLTNTPPAQPSQ